MRPFFHEYKQLRFLEDIRIIKKKKKKKKIGEKAYTD